MLAEMHTGGWFAECQPMQSENFALKFAPSLHFYKKIGRTMGDFDAPVVVGGAATAAAAPNPYK